MTIPAELASIMEAGVRAPSADNHHAFEFVVSDRCITLVGDASHDSLPFHRVVLNRISLGAVVENMVIRASRLGYRATPSWQPDGQPLRAIVELRLTDAATPAGDVELDEAIASRHTNRTLKYSGPALPEEDLAAIRASIADIDGARLILCDSPRERSALLELVRVAETERFRTRALHQELFSALRFDVGWKQPSAEGIPPGALGIEPGLRWAFSQLRHWPLMRPLQYLGLHHALGFRAADLPCRLAPHCGVLTTTLAVAHGAPAVGRALQRIWLGAHRRALAFQPLAAAALLALPDYDGVPDATRSRLRTGWQSLTDETPLMVFRMGRAAPPAVRAARSKWLDLLRD